MGEKGYTLVVVNDYPRFTWVTFLATKDEALKSFARLVEKFKMRRAS